MVKSTSDEQLLRVPRLIFRLIQQIAMQWDARIRRWIARIVPLNGFAFTFREMDIAHDIKIDAQLQTINRAPVDRDIILKLCQKSGSFFVQEDNISSMIRTSCKMKKIFATEKA